jgi:hypothetical protein
MPSEGERIELPVQARIARRDAHERHLATDLEWIRENGVQHKSIEPARRGRRRAHLDRPSLRLVIVVNYPSDQLTVRVDDTDRAAIAEAAIVAKQQM